MLKDFNIFSFLNKLYLDIKIFKVCILKDQSLLKNSLQINCLFSSFRTQPFIVWLGILGSTGYILISTNDKRF